MVSDCDAIPRNERSYEKSVFYQLSGHVDSQATMFRKRTIRSVSLLFGCTSFFVEFRECSKVIVAQCGVGGYAIVCMYF